MGAEEGAIGMASAALASPTTSSLGSFTMSSGPCMPLERDTALSLIGPSDTECSTRKKKKKKKLVRFPRDDCEFYTNIWKPPASTTDAQEKNKFIDIAQVAHALTMIDYKSDYEGAANSYGENIWTVDDADLGFDEDAEDNASRLSFEDSYMYEPTPASARRILSQENRMREPPAQYQTLDRLLSQQGTHSLALLAVPPPTKHADARFIFSVVLSQADVRDRWSSKFLLSLHEPVRHALYVMDRFLERAQSKDMSEDWDTATFFQWFADYFCEYIEAQQRIKATVLRPLVQIKYTTKREIAECYDEIIFMLNAIMTHEEMFPITAASAVQSWQRRLQVLQEDIRKLNVVLFHVLNLEERTLQPALLSTFNEDTFYKFVMPRVYSAARPKKLIIPWIIERSKVWGDDKDVSMFKKQLSFPSRFLYDRVWYPHFTRHVVAAMKILDSTMIEMPTQAESDGGFQCTIQ